MPFVLHQIPFFSRHGLNSRLSDLSSLDTLPSGLRKKCSQRRTITSAAKAAAENKLVIAAVNRCATQKQSPTPSFLQPARELFVHIFLYG
jgi:hypothetical protein